MPQADGHDLEDRLFAVLVREAKGVTPWHLRLIFIKRIVASIEDIIVAEVALWQSDRCGDQAQASRDPRLRCTRATAVTGGRLPQC